MTQALQNNNQEEWLKVLGKGMVTIPKKWRKEMGIENGDIIKAKKEGNKVVIEAVLPQAKINAPYRVYGASEIDEFLKEDKLPEKLAKQARTKLSASIRS